MSERFKAIPAVYGLFRRGEEILLIRRYQTGYMDGYYGLPAGHVEQGEGLEGALRREMKEEVGVTVPQDGCSLAHVRSRNTLDGHRLDFFFEIEQWEGEVINLEPHKCDDMQWFSVAHLPEATIPYIKNVLSAIQRKTLYSEEGWK